MTAILEREAELATLDAAAAEAAGGVPAVILLEGPAGIGKTRLMAAARERAAAYGLRVLSAVGGELEHDDAFGIARQLFAGEPARSELTAGEARWAVGALKPGGPPTDLAAALHGLFWLTAELAAERPTALLVDDAHWADAPSLRFLERLARRADDIGLLLIVGARANEPGAPPELDALRSLARVRRLRPRPLSAAATARLVRDLIADADEAFCRTCHDVTGGNPFLLTETARAASVEGAGDPAAVRPDSVARSVLGRLEQVAPPVRALAAAAAVLGKSGELRHAALLADLDLEAAEAAAARLVDIGILDDGDGQLRFVHPLVRTTIYEARPRTERSSAHRRLARALREEGAEPERAALHLLSTAPGGQPWVVETLRAAARSARDRGVPDAATGYLRRALEEPPPPQLRGVLLRDLATSGRRASDPSSLEHMAAAIELMEDGPLRRADRRRLAFWTYGAARAAEAVAMLDALAAETDGTPESLDDRAHALSIAIFAGLPDLADRAAALERVAQDPNAPGAVHDVLAYFHTVAGRPQAQCRDELRRAAGRMDFGGRAVQPALFSEITVSCAFGEVYDTLDALVEAALASARQAGSLYHTATPHQWAALGALRRGNLIEAERHALATRDALQPGLTDTYYPTSAYVLAEVALERGDVAAARRHVDEGGIETDDRHMLSQAWTLPAAARVAFAEGRLEHGLALLQESGRRLGARGFDNPGIAFWRGCAAVPLAAAGRLDEAQALADEELGLARAFGGPRAVGVALRVAGIAHADVEVLRDAVTTLDGAQAALDLARARTDLGSALRRARHRREAREPLRLALDGAIRCGATTLAQRAREELEATGARLRTGILSGLEAMTPSERRVAELAAQGLSNRQIAETLFVTIKTVEAHLGRVYRKLDVSSRTELSDALNPAAASPS